MPLRRKAHSPALQATALEVRYAHGVEFGPTPHGAKLIDLSFGLTHNVIARVLLVAAILEGNGRFGLTSTTNCAVDACVTACSDSIM